MNDIGSGPREDLFRSVADAVRGMVRQKPRISIGIDGPDASGKTTLADALAKRLRGRVIRASIDSFHNPRDQRQRRGALSPEGYYRDSFDYPTLRTRLLDPFRDGSPEIATSLFDYRADAETSSVSTPVPRRAVLVFDGVFLLRPELRDCWDVSLYLHVSEEESVRRALIRDEDLFGSVDEVRRRYIQRYLPGQAIYRHESDPMALAGIVIDNTAPERPMVMNWRLGSSTLE